MSCDWKTLYAFAAILSPILVLIIILTFLYHKMAHKTGRSHLIQLLLLFISVWLFRWAETTFAISIDADGFTNLSWWEAVVDSMIHTLQSFSMDESYSEYHALGEQMISQQAWRGGWTAFFSVYSSALNVIAPITGGAVILDILADIMPGTVQLNFWRRKVYFSKLNDNAVALAKSILSESGESFWNRPLIIFADADVDNENDSGSELYCSAKALGGYCLHKDITNIRLHGLRERIFILNDENELNNLNKLAAFCNEESVRVMKKTSFYLYYQDDQYCALERDIANRLDELCSEKYSKAIARAKTLLRWKRNIRHREPLPDSTPSDSLSEVEERLLRWGMYPWSELYQEAQKCNSEPVTEQALREQKILEKAAKKESAVHTEEALTLEIQKEAESKYYPIIARTQIYTNMIRKLYREYPLYLPILENINGKGCDNNRYKDRTAFNLTILGSGHIAMQAFRMATWCGQMFDRLQINLVSDEARAKVEQRLNHISPEILKSTTVDDDILSVYSDLLTDISDQLPTCSKLTEKNEPYFTFRYLEQNVADCGLDGLTCGQDRYEILNSDYFIVALGSDQMNISIANALKQAILRKATESGQKRAVVIAYAVYSPELNRVYSKASAENRMFDSDGILQIPFGSLADSYTVDSVFGSYSRNDTELLNNEYQKISRKEAYKEGRTRIDQEYKYWSNLARENHLQYRMFSAWRFCRVLGKGRFNQFQLENGGPTRDTYVSYRTAIDSTAVEDKLAWLEHRRWNAYLRSEGFIYGETYDKDKQRSLRIHPCLVECALGICTDTPDRLDEAGKRAKTEYKVYDSPYSGDISLLDNIIGKQ